MMHTVLEHQVPKKEYCSDYRCECNSWIPTTQSFTSYMQHEKISPLSMEEILGEVWGEFYTPREPLELEKEFEQLVELWHNETDILSSIFEKAMHPAYQQIIGMGMKAVPLILRTLREQGGHWFWALSAITRERPVEPGADYNTAVHAWLEWGRRLGHI